VDVVVSGEHETPGDTDFFSFSATAGRYYRIETSNLLPAGESDTILVLYDTDQSTVLAEDDQSGSEANASRILWACERSDTYYFEVYQFSTLETGSYDVIAADEGQAPEDDHADEPGPSATGLTLGADPVAGEIAPAGDVDYFSADVLVDIVYDIETSSLGTGSDTVLSLYSPEGQYLLEDDQGGLEFNASRLIWMASESDTFYAEVSQFLAGSTGTYEISARSEGPAAAVITDGTPVAGNLLYAGDIDAFSFQALSGHSYLITVTTSNVFNRFMITLLGTDGMTPLAENSFADSNLVWQAPAGGQYLLIVREDEQGGQYDLSVLDQGLPPADADLDNDGDIDYQDLYLFQGRWQQGGE
jgi:hypothetical protein